MLNRLMNWLGYEQRALSRQSHPFLVEAPSLTNIAVTVDTALRCPAVLCAVQVLSSDLASLPIFVYQRPGRERAEAHPAYALLHEAPNDFMGASLWKKTFWTNLFTHGDGYSLIQRNGGGRAVSTVNVYPSRVQTVVGDQSYHYVIDGTIKVDPADMIHVRFFSEDGIHSVSPIKLAREPIALLLAMDMYGAAFFGNGARLSGFLKYPGTLSDTGAENLSKSWQAKHGGIANAFRTPVLENGTDYVQLSSSNEEAQYNQTRAALLVSIAQAYNIPPHKLKDLGRATWNNISSESLSYVRDSLRPWTIAFEEQLQKLFLPSERASYYAEHELKELLRADQLTRMQVYQIGIDKGFFLPDEIRAWENLEPLPEPIEETNEQEMEQAQPQEAPPSEDTNNGNPNDTSADNGN